MQCLKVYESIYPNPIRKDRDRCSFSLVVIVNLYWQLSTSMWLCDTSGIPEVVGLRTAGGEHFPVGHTFSDRIYEGLYYLWCNISRYRTIGELYCQ